MLNRRQMLASLPAPLLAQTRKPNIVFIVSDDQHWQCLGAAGNPHIKTPNLDKLAGRGVYFTNAIISCPQCAPSRGILLSGQECYQNGLDSNGHLGFRFFKGATVVEQLRRAGYETNLVGKWHIEPTPKQCGFTKAPVWLEAAAIAFQDPELRKGLDATADERIAGHITEIFTREAVRVIESAKQPYLLWLTYNAPHQPWSADDRFRKLYQGHNARLAPPNHPKPAPPSPVQAGQKSGQKKRGGQNNRPDGAYDWETYYAVISQLDEGIGKVIDAVEKSGQWDNTLIIFISDNGYLAGSKGLQGKVFAWEESIRIPFLVAGGPVKKPGRSDAPVASIDVPATMLDYAGVRPSHKLSGASLRPVLNGQAFPRDTAFSAWNDGRPEALLVPMAVEPYRVGRSRTHKYIVWESKKEAFFDLRADPFEEKNLVADAGHAAALGRARDRMRARLKETDDSALSWIP